eukprot:COSAG06_NODE_7_length_38054_cov_37.302569_9_plen_192_part_00
MGAKSWCPNRRSQSPANAISVCAHNCEQEVGMFIGQEETPSGQHARCRPAARTVIPICAATFCPTIVKSSNLSIPTRSQNAIGVSSLYAQPAARPASTTRPTGPHRPASMGTSSLQVCIESHTVCHTHYTPQLTFTTQAMCGRPAAEWCRMRLQRLISSGRCATRWMAMCAAIYHSSWLTHANRLVLTQAH